MSFFKKQKTGIKRRDFLLLSAGTVGALGTGICRAAPSSGETKDAGKPLRAQNDASYNGPYSGERLNRVAFPMGGMGAGMICLEGSGALSHVSLRNRPEIFNEPVTFAAVSVKGEPHVARVLEGPAPDWKKFGNPGSGNGAAGAAFGL